MEKYLNESIKHCIRKLMLKKKRKNGISWINVEHRNKGNENECKEEDKSFAI